MIQTGSVQCSASSPNSRKVPLRNIADRLDVTPTGALKILKRAGMAIRDDGRWFARPDHVDAIEAALRTLGKLKTVEP